MRYIVDIDNTICYQNEPGDYPNSIPFQERIDKLNQLYDEGNEIIYWTARGMNSGKDWTDLTREQLRQWECKFNDLWMQKPAYDVWVDDKANWIFK